MDYLIDLLGWGGAGAVLIAYLWSSFGRIPSNGFFLQLYQGLNMAGAIGLLLNSLYYGAVPSVIVNAIWAFIAMVALLKIKKKERMRHAHA